MHDQPTYSAIIVEDEKPSLNLLYKMLSLQPRISELHTATSIAQALQVLSDHDPDIYFLDVELPDGTSFELLDQINWRPKAICMVTSYEQYAIQAIKRGVIDYILKPISEYEVEQAVGRIVNLLNNSENINNKKLVLQSFHRRVILGEYDVTHIQAEDHCSFVYHIDCTRIVTAYTLAQFEAQLSESFIRIHKSYIANLNHVAEVDKGRGGYLRTTSGFEIPVSYRRKRQLLNKLG